MNTSGKKKQIMIDHVFINLYKPAILLGEKYCIIHTFNYSKNLSGKLKYVCTRCVAVVIKSISNQGCEPKESIFSTALKCRRIKTQY